VTIDQSLDNVLQEPGTAMTAAKRLASKDVFEVPMEGLQVCLSH
jgi:hypothetical protein